MNQVCCFKQVCFPPPDKPRARSWLNWLCQKVCFCPFRFSGTSTRAEPLQQVGCYCLTSTSHQVSWGQMPAVRDAWEAPCLKLQAVLLFSACSGLHTNSFYLLAWLTERKSCLNSDYSMPTPVFSKLNSKDGARHQGINPCIPLALWKLRSIQKTNCPAGSATWF